LCALAVVGAINPKTTRKIAISTEARTTLEFMK
jgi:hypothetical protein